MLSLTRERPHICMQRLRDGDIEKSPSGQECGREERASQTGPIGGFVELQTEFLGGGKG